MFILGQPNTQDLPIGLQEMQEVGVYQAGAINMDDLVFHPWARKACEDNACGKYNTNWACPPATGSIEEAESICRQYDKGFLFNGKYGLKRDTDFRGMIEGQKKFQNMVLDLNDLIKRKLDDYLLMSVGGCSYCKKCSYPDPCRYPDKLFLAVEGLGLNVSDLARRASLSYSEHLSIIYLGLVLYK